MIAIIVRLWQEHLACSRISEMSTRPTVALNPVDGIPIRGERTSMALRIPANVSIHVDVRMQSNLDCLLECSSVLGEMEEDPSDYLSQQSLPAAGLIHDDIVL
jgi:hypothetical protein